MKVVFLVGFMGAGKSRVGRSLAERLNWTFEDLDDRIERSQGRKIAEIFQNAGESSFREAEHTALKQLLDEVRGGVSRVVALGGGAFVQSNNAALLKAAKVPTVYLDAPVEELWRRCSEQAGTAGAQRPLLQSKEQFRRLHDRRRKGYLKASLKIATGGRDVEAVAADITKALGLHAIAARTELGETE